MIAVDTNVLVYAHRKDSAFHANAYECVRRLAEGRSTWAIPWPCIHEFFAIVTHPRIFKPPSSPSQAIEQVSSWLESPSLELLAESGRHWEQLCPLIQRAKVAGPQVHDARIAALCLQHGVRELWSADRDFNRYPDFNVRNPLIR